MTYLDRAVARTAGFGIVAACSIVPGLILGIVIAIASGEPGAIALALGGPIACLLLQTPMRHLFVLAARIPFSIVFVGPVILAYWLFVKPAEFLAVRKGWVEMAA